MRRVLKPGLLSDSSLSSLVDQDTVLLSKLEEFYKTPGHLAAFVAVLGGKSPVSLRTLEHLVTNYARRTGLSYVHDGEIFNVYDEYQAWLTSYNKSKMDPFQRGKKTKHIDFHGVQTTICQLNYFRWVLSNGVLDFCKKNLKAVRADMVASSRKRAPGAAPGGTQAPATVADAVVAAPKRRRQQAKSKSKECHVVSGAFTHSFD